MKRVTSQNSPEPIRSGRNSLHKNFTKGIFLVLEILVLVSLNGVDALTDVTACGQSLNVPGETYQLIQNISSAGSCLLYGADNVVLDLNGYTLTFDTVNAGGVNGIRGNNFNNLILTNSRGIGRIIQSTTCPLATTECSGDRAINFGGDEGSTIENIYVGVQGYDTHGIFVGGGTWSTEFFNVLNNTVNHSGTHLSSRGGFTSMPIKIDKVYYRMNISYNSILDSPHGGIIVDKDRKSVV